MYWTLVVTVFEDMVFETNIGHCAILYFVKYLVKYKIHKCILYFKYICKKYFIKYFEILLQLYFVFKYYLNVFYPALFSAFHLYCAWQQTVST